MENQKRATDPVWSPSLHKIRKIVVTKNEPVLYHLGSDDEYAPKRGFVLEELMPIDLEKLPRVYWKKTLAPDLLISFVLLIKCLKPLHMLRSVTENVLVKLAK